MSYKIRTENGEVKKDIYEFAIDTPDDLANLPRHCGMGSIAIIISTSEVYMKNGDGEWIKL